MAAFGRSPSFSSRTRASSWAVCPGFPAKRRVRGGATGSMLGYGLRMAALMVSRSVSSNLILRPIR